MAANGDVAAALDAAAEGPLVVYGSPPPRGRDLDLLVRDDDLPALTAELGRLGAVRRGDQWAVLGDGSAYGVELFPISRWGLPPAEVDALFGEASPLDGYARLARPSPRHALLVAARAGTWTLKPARVAAALAEDPAAQDDAQSSAHAWGVTLGPDAGRRRPPLGPPRVVALSGLDGSGKSTQARALAGALRDLGYDVHVEWAPILQNRSVELLSAAARVPLRLLRRGGSAGGDGGGASLVAQVEASSAARRAVREAWTAYVALVNGASHRRPALRHRGRGTVVVYDRFVLDSTVRMRFLYGRDASFALQRRIVGLLSPRPVAAFWLDVPAERAYARKPEHWDVEQLAAQRELYAEEHERLGVVRLDGERPPADLAREIATEVWGRL